MFFVKCAVKGCSAKEDGFYASEDESGWTVTPGPHGTSRSSDEWWCPEHKPSLKPPDWSPIKSSIKMDPVANNPSTLGEVWIGETLPDPAAFAAVAKLQEKERVRKEKEANSWKERMTEYPDLSEHPDIAEAVDEFAKLFEDEGKDALQREFGFNDTEEGSEERYERRKTVVPWAKHTFWWVIHNAVAHPLIAVLPRRASFQFHDWTSRKMHGR